MKSNIISLCKYRAIYIAFGIVLAQLIISNMWYIILLPVYCIYLIKMHQNIIVITGILTLIFVINYNIQIESELKSSAQYDVKVIKVNNNNDYTNFIGKTNGNLVSVYLSDRMQIKPGDLYTIKSQPSSIINQTIPGNFSYKKYLLSKKIKYQFYLDEIEYVRTDFSIHMLTQKVEEYIEENMPLSQSYIKTFILADKSDFDQDTLDNINLLGISHLFAVSGLHVGLLVLALEHMFRSMKNFRNYTAYIIIGFLLIYMLITSFSPSVVRASMMYILLVINKRTKIGFSTLDLLSIIYIVLSIYNPFSYYNPGFVLSFFVTLFLILSSDLLKKYKGLQLIFVIGYISFIATIPIILSLNYKINLYTLFINVIFLLIMSYLILPLSYITFLFPYIDRLLYFFITLYEVLIEISSKIDSFLLTGNFMHKWQFMIYFIFVHYYMTTFREVKRRKKLTILLFLIVLLFTNFNYFSPFTTITFLDVKGDSTVIIDKYNRCNILIDTGIDDEYDSVINYLKYKNIKRLDYLFISHFHSDHVGELEDIRVSINVKNIITPNNLSEYQSRMITCGSIEYYIYDLTNTAVNENNRSIMMSVFVKDKHYFFTGDAELKREYEFINKYDIDVDYLKIAHHGSSTSSSIDFIEALNPKEAFVMVYRDNMFGHPNEDVMARYHALDVDVHRTDYYGTIEVVYFLDFEEKKYYMP